MPSTFPLPLWAAQVAAATPLPDGRLNTRLERLLTQLASKPLDAFPQAAPDCHQAKATYRFLSNNRFGHDDLLTGWRATTTSTLGGQDLIYVAHDTTTFSYSSLKHTTGLGYINQIEACRGIHCHSALALQANGVVLGYSSNTIGSAQSCASPTRAVAWAKTARAPNGSAVWRPPTEPWLPCRHRRGHA